MSVVEEITFSFIITSKHPEFFALLFYLISYLILRLLILRSVSLPREIHSPNPIHHDSQQPIIKLYNLKMKSRVQKERAHECT